MKKPLRIALVMKRSSGGGGAGWLGGIEYFKNIVFALASLPADVRSTFEVCLVCSKSVNSDFYSQVHSYLKDTYYHETELKPYTSLNRIRWKISNILLKQGDPEYEPFLRREKIDFAYPYFAKGGKQTPYRSAAWIFDFQHKYLPQFFSKVEAQERDNLFALTARYAPTIVLSSKTAESDFHQFFPEAAHKTKVLSFKTSPLSEWYEGDPQLIQQKYSLPDRFFLVSNQFWQHKNHLVIFKALKLLHDQSVYPEIVFTGQLYDYRKPDYSNTVLQTIHQLGVAHQVYLLGIIPRIDQIQLMRRSLAVIQPSLFEGWSTVVEDSRAMGKHIVLSDLPVNIEQNPPHSLFFERDSPENLASLLGDWWQQLSPGPNLEQETVARTNSAAEVQAFGYNFLEIAKGLPKK